MESAIAMVDKNEMEKTRLFPLDSRMRSESEGPPANPSSRNGIELELISDHLDSHPVGQA
jgi:hypothetical protein